MDAGRILTRWRLDIINGLVVLFIAGVFAWVFVLDPIPLRNHRIQPSGASRVNTERLRADCSIVSLPGISGVSKVGKLRP